MKPAVDQGRADSDSLDALIICSGQSVSRANLVRAQRLCLLCDQRAVGDERHMVFECPALQGVRDKYAALFVDGASTMQQFLWR